MRRQKTVPLEQRYVIDSKSGCWIWTGVPNSCGYGIIRINYKSYRAHRFIFERHKGKIPVGKQLDHLCRNRNCVNPEHLEIVTNIENIHRGKCTVLTWDKVTKIRKLYKEEKVSQQELAFLFNVSNSSVSEIINNKRWK